MNMDCFVKSLNNQEREELIRALLPQAANNQLTTMDEFLGKNPRLPGRVANLLKASGWEYAELVSRNEFLKLRGAGKWSWEQFVLYRGY